MLYVDGMNGLIRHNETVEWLYTLVGSKVKDTSVNNECVSSEQVSTKKGHGPKNQPLIQVMSSNS